MSVSPPRWSQDASQLENPAQANAAQPHLTQAHLTQPQVKQPASTPDPLTATVASRLHVSRETTPRHARVRAPQLTPSSGIHQVSGSPGVV